MRVNREWQLGRFTRPLDHLGHADASSAIVKAIETVLVNGPRTRDMGGTASTQELGKAIAEAV